MEQQLIRLGLSHKEAKVYLALVELGGGTISLIAQRAHINRTTVYDVIVHLVEMGLATKAVGTKKQEYIAEPIEKLPLILEKRAETIAEQAKEAKTLVEQLRLLPKNTKGRPRIRYFDGTEGIKSLYEDSLLSREHIRSFSSTDSLESFDQRYLHQYYRRRAAKRISIQAIINDVPSAHLYKKQDPELAREIRIVPKEKMDVKPEIYMYENKVAIFSLKEKFAVLVESEDIANAFKKLYDLAWDHAKEYSKKNT